MSFWLLGIGGLLLALRAEVFWFPPAHPPCGERASGDFVGILPIKRKLIKIVWELLTFCY